jgi:cholesterol transport system auxiliary component
MMRRISVLLFAPIGLVLLVTACSLLPAPKQAVSERYVLEYTPPTVTPGAGQRPVLIVDTPAANGAYDSSRIAYLQQQYGLRYYANSRWADTPANMLEPLLVEAINAGGRIQAVGADSGGIAASLRLDSTLLRFYQDFTVRPSQLRITLRVQLVDLRAQRVVATRVFDIREPAATEDTYGGVQAANHAVAALLQQVVDFCAAHSG